MVRRIRGRTVENIAAKSELHMKRCNNCPLCVLLLLHEYNMLLNAYLSLNTAYRYLLAPSVTQVTCERVFFFVEVSQDKIEKYNGPIKIGGIYAGNGKL